MLTKKLKCKLAIQLLFTFVLYISFFAKNSSNNQKVNGFESICDTTYYHSTNNSQYTNYNYPESFVVEINEITLAESEKLEQLDDLSNKTLFTSQKLTYNTHKTNFFAVFEISKSSNFLYILYCSLKIHLFLI